MAARVVLAALSHVWAALEPTHCPHALDGWTFTVVLETRPEHAGC